jgi:acetyl esterase/lipase
MRFDNCLRRDLLRWTGGAASVAILSADCGSIVANSKGPRVHYGDDRFQFGDLQLPRGDGPHPVVIVIHGGFWRSQYGLDHIAPLCPALNAAGWATWNIEYRRVGNPGGGWPGTFLDVASAADYLRELAPKHNLDLKRVVSLGHSAGGHLALWLAGRSRIPAGSELHPAKPLSLHGAVSLTGVVDLRQGHAMALGTGAVRALVGGTPESHSNRYTAGSPADLLPLGVKQILIHGKVDPIVPIDISRSYRKAAMAKGDQVDLIELEGGHFELVSPETAQGKKVVESLGRFLVRGDK